MRAIVLAMLVRRLMALLETGRRCNDDSIASMLCSPSGPAPSIALCLAGAARTFQNKLVHRSLKENVIERLGAPVTTFAFLKLSDGRGDSRPGFNGSIEATRIGVSRALALLGVTRLQLKNTSYNAPPLCSNYPTYRTRIECPNCHVDGAAHQQSLLGQLEGRAMCYQMISEYERRRDHTFDSVLVVRPDLTWYDSVAPWCRHRLPKRVFDWVFWLPRAEAAQQLWAPWEEHYSCKTPPVIGSNVESFVKKYTGLMNYTTGQRSLPALITRIAEPGFPSSMERTCTKRIVADPGLNHCHQETSGNICNARRTPHTDTSVDAKTVTPSAAK